MSRKDLTSLDFEGILKYFRVSLPKKYRSEENVRQLFKLATSLKVKRLDKYQRDYLLSKGKLIRLYTREAYLNYSYHNDINL